jgi:hypothetical protein
LLNIGNSLREKRHPGVPNISDDTLIKLRPITPAQLDLLVANGRSHESASKLNRDQASLAISELFAKQDATPRQIAYLEHLGYDFSDGYNLTKEVASQKITDLVETKGEGELSEEDSDINESDANSQLYERKIQTPSGHQNDKRNGCIGCISFLFIILLVLYFIF